MAERDGPDAAEALRQAASAAVVGAAVGAARALASRRNGRSDDDADEQEHVVDRVEEEVEEEPEPQPDEHDEDDDDDDDDDRDGDDVQQRHPSRGVVDSARRHLQELRGEEAESVSSLTPTANGWRVALEVVEVHRIPASTDVLASYEVEVDADGELLRFERTGRYYRSQADRGGDL